MAIFRPGVLSPSLSWLGVLLAVFAVGIFPQPATAQDDRSIALLHPEQRRILTELEQRLGRKNSFALVIGISDYDRWPRLSGVRTEVETIGTALDAQGFDVEPLDGEGRVNIGQLRKRIAEFVRLRGANPENRLVIYVASHGYKDARTGGYGFLAASDTLRPGQDGFEASAYSVRELSAALTGLAAKHVFLFFNACFSGAMVPDPTRGEPAVPTVGDKPPGMKALSPEAAAWTRDLLAHNARLVLTAGSDDQTVPDAANPYYLSIAEGLSGAADADRDGLILGMELAQYVRGRVGREMQAKGHPNQPVFAVLPKFDGPGNGQSAVVDYRLQGDFVFLSPQGPSEIASQAGDEGSAILAAKNARLLARQFVECVDCPTMVEVPQMKMAIGRTEVTFAEWDACNRELGCRRYLPDDGGGRGDRPVSGVTWQDALEFVLWMEGKKKQHCVRYRLLKKAEWLTVAGAGADKEPNAIIESGGVSCSGCGPGADQGRSLAVGSLGSNGLGVSGMVGNLWEWVDNTVVPSGGEAAESDLCDASDLLDRFKALREHNTCRTPGTVMGGSFATSANVISASLEADLVRTSNERPWSWQTVGLRIACDLR